MNSYILALVFILALPALACGQGVSEADQMRAEANRWLAAAGPRGLVLVKQDTGASFVRRFDLEFQYRAGEYDLAILMYADAIAGKLTLEKLRAGFRGFVIDSLPLPYFRRLSGWEAIPRSSSSQFNTGVEFISLSGWELNLHVRLLSSIFGGQTHVPSRQMRGPLPTLSLV